MKTNYHTHSNYCDGKNSIEEIILSAIEKGFDIIGFSGHSYTDYDESYCMSQEDTKKYKNTIRELKEKYKDKITVLCGIEQDFYSKEATAEYDYVIGSVHAYEKNGEYIYVDWDIDTIKNAANKYYNGDYLALAEDYYRVVSELPEKTGCDIIGHFDLLTKFNEKEHLFDETAPRYIQAVEAALDKIISYDVIFEINTGAIAKGYRTTPYPSKDILERIKAKGGNIMINSDCHLADALDCYFEEAKQLAKNCGFENTVIITESERYFQRNDDRDDD